MSLLREKYRQIAELVIFDHTRKGPCLFAPTAVDDIADAAVLASATDPCLQSVQAAMVTAIEAAEIYCPHEGIDRRAEFGIAA
jgi:hypothetical protein